MTPPPERPNGRRPGDAPPESPWSLLPPLLGLTAAQLAGCTKLDASAGSPCGQDIEGRFQASLCPPGKRDSIEILLVSPSGDSLRIHLDSLSPSWATWQLANHLGTNRIRIVRPGSAPLTGQVDILQYSNSDLHVGSSFRAPTADDHSCKHWPAGPDSLFASFCVTNPCW